MKRNSSMAGVVFSLWVSAALILSAVITSPVQASAPDAKVRPPTVTPTPVVTSTPAPTITPVTTETLVPIAPSLTVQSDPTYIEPGGQVTFLYQISNLEKITETTTLRFHVPLGFMPLNPEEGKYDETKGVFEIIPTEPDGKIAWQADKTVIVPLGIYVELLQGEEIIADAKIELSAPVEYKIEMAGGTAESADGKIQVNFPTGAVSEAVMVKVTEPSYEALPITSLSGSPFEITAISENGKEEVTRFGQPVEIQIQYNEGMLNGSETDLLLFWYDPLDGQWKMPLSQRVDIENNRIIATTDHFTVFDTYNSNWQTSQAPTLSGFQTADFTGAATYTMGIQVPPGPGGFQPGLTLNYNSMVVDGAGSETQASWVGMGWSLTNSAIERNGHGTNEVQDDSYQLTLNGMSVELLPDANGVYHASNENFHRMELSNPSNDSISKWTIWDRNGYKYIFDHRTMRAHFSTCAGGVSGSELGEDVWRWSLTEIVNPFGKVTEYDYEVETSTHYYLDCGAHLSGVAMENWVYPSAITYANQQYRIEFVRTQDRTDYKNIWYSPYSSAFYVFQRSRLTAIRILQSNNGVFDTVIREYRFTYADEQAPHIFPYLTWDAGGKTLTLSSVQEYGLGGYQGPNSPSQPAVTFSYDDGIHLTSASNGHGGTMTFAYDDYNHNGVQELPDELPWKAEIPYGTWGATEATYGPPAWGNPKAYHFSTTTDGWEGTGSFPNYTGKITNYGSGTMTFWGLVKNPNETLMANKTFQPGRWYMAVASARADNTPGTHNISIGFAYKDPNGVEHDSWGAPVTLGQQYSIVSSGAFFVPLDATTIVPKMNSTGSSKVTWYYLYPLTTAYRVTSRTASTAGDALTYLYDYNGAAVNTAENSQAAAGSHPYSRAYTEFRGHSFVTVTDPFGGKAITEYWQSDCYAGSPKTVTVKDANGTTARESTFTYYGEEDDSCVTGTSSLQLYDQDTRDPNLYNTLFDSLKFYWGRTTSETSTVFGTTGGSLTTSYEYEPTYGNLLSQEVTGSIPHTLTTTYQYLAPIITTEKYIVSLPSSVSVDNGADTLAETLYYYDANGIPTKTRALMSAGQYSQMDFGYDAWGNATSQTVYTDYSNGSSDPAAGAQTATTTYDPTYHTYPLTITNAIGHTTHINYSSVAVPGTGYTGYTIGAPVSAYGPNGTDTTVSAEYDSFGRLVKLIRPGDDSASPTLQIAYTGTNPFTTTLTQKIQNGQFYTVTRQYDGLGRPTSATAGGVTTTYQYGYVNISGQLHRYDSVSMPGDTQNFATTIYDSLGRAWTATAPDGSATTYAYDGLETTVTDANTNSTSTTTDILGRTTFVDAPTGPDITFEYDDLGNLISAERGGAETTMQYDLGGRKTSMSDPDMGDWVYDYDALNNLLTQTDARACTLTMTYDALNRLDTKISSGTYCGQQINVDYDYDSGTYGIGFRTSMEDGTGTNPTTWEYDKYGHLVKEIKWIDNDSFTTEWNYNKADLMTWMKYPDGEEVTYNYNSRMLLNSVYGTNTYVSSTSYDSAGRVADRALGNSLTQKFVYKPWDVEGGRLDAIVSGSGTWNQSTLLFTNMLQKLSYDYDDVGNITQIEQVVNFSTSETETQSFTYDALNRLKTWTLANSPTKNYDYNAAGNLSVKEDVALEYNDTNHAHAVTDANGNSYDYDANGNMSQRVIVSGPQAGTYDLLYDAENRLVEVKKNNTTIIARFTFDGDGGRVKSIVNGETLLFVGTYFEQDVTSSPAKITKYYLAGDRVAMRKYAIPQTMSVEYTLGDHLGSTSITTDALGNKVSELRYTPWGEVRYSWIDSALVTTPDYELSRYTFTGQYSYVEDFQLMFYNARFYDPAIGRFAGADSVVPDGVQGRDRYAYTVNNPLKYVDPTGHDVDCGIGDPVCQGGWWYVTNPDGSTGDRTRCEELSQAISKTLSAADEEGISVSVGQTYRSKAEAHQRSTASNIINGKVSMFNLLQLPVDSNGNSIDSDGNVWIPAICKSILLPEGISPEDCIKANALDMFLDLGDGIGGNWNLACLAGITCAKASWQTGYEGYDPGTEARLPNSEDVLISAHTTGLAVDLSFNPNQSDRVGEIAASFGLTRPLLKSDKEFWHFEHPACTQ